MDYTQVAYAGWQPVRINLGYGGAGSDADIGTNGFFLNETGLQWNGASGSAPETNPAADSFAGWVVCDWWHGK